MSPSTEVLFQQLYNTENSVLVSAIRGDLSDLQERVKQLKSLWKQISQAKDKQLVLEARKSFFNEALKILSGKLSDAKTIEELEEKAGAYFKESQARKAAQEVNKGQAGGGVAVGLNQWLNFINEGIEVVLEEMRLWFVLAEETRFTEMEKMLQQYNTMLQVLDECMDIIDMSVVGMASNLNRTKQTVEAHAGFKSPFPPSNQSPSTSSLPPVLASTLAPIAEAQEPNDNKAVQPKENESKMDCATTVAIAIDQSTIADNSALVSDPVAIVTDSIISSRSATKSVACTGPAASITDSAIATDSIRTGSQ
ncbi:hypothetical protein E4T56_gene11789 [Termitomyces sp. T112]|nr:hypothetical protein E4T56_gene11789 [Termitomyces sp. T112]